MTVTKYSGMNDRMNYRMNYRIVSRVSKEVIRLDYEMPHLLCAFVNIMWLGLSWSFGEAQLRLGAYLGGRFMGSTPKWILYCCKSIKTVRKYDQIQCKPPPWNPEPPKFCLVPACDAICDTVEVNLLCYVTLLSFCFLLQSVKSHRSLTVPCSMDSY